MRTPLEEFRMRAQFHKKWVWCVLLAALYEIRESSVQYIASSDNEHKEKEHWH
jgi:hypothetical protein